MKNILVIGAGLSSSYLIHYLLQHAEAHNWLVTVGDANKEMAAQKLNGHTRGKAIELDINDTYELDLHITAANLVISLLPPTMHIVVAKNCIARKRHLITASYITDEMKNLHVEALKANVLLLNECGLDPGIDHMSAMRVLHTIEQKGGVVKTFKSYCGGLVAPAFDDNPWHYKFTWNPRNVVLAGQHTARYLENNELKFIPPSRIFKQLENVSVKGESFECYANRDSLEYIKPYKLEKAHTVLRGTMRVKAYAEAWNCIAVMGLNDDSFVIHETDKLTYRQWVSAFIPGNDLEKLESRVAQLLQVNEQSEVFQKLVWLGLFEETKINMREATSAQILQYLLQQKWKLKTGELDRIVMLHQIAYSLENKNYQIESSLTVIGEDATLTAMAKTVGLPMGIAAKLLLSNEIKTRGVQMPILPELYIPILNELESFGVKFEEGELLIG